MRWPIVVGIAAAVGGGAWFALRARSGAETAPSSKPGSNESYAPLSVLLDTAAIAAPSSPTLLVGSGEGARSEPAAAGEATPALPTPPALPIPSERTKSKEPSQAFASQQRDPVWAPATEREIKKRFQAVRGGTLQAAECRHDVCQLLIEGTSDDLATAQAWLETPRGLRGFARSVLLAGPPAGAEPPAPGTTATAVLTVYASFDR